MNKIIYYNYYIDIKNWINILQVLIDITIKLDNQLYKR